MSTVAEIFQTMEYGPAPESDKEALTWLGKHERVFGHYIDGAWTEPGSMFEVINPSTAKTIARVTNGTAAEVDAAVRAARAALPKWKALTPHARARYLYALARGVQKHSRLLAVLESMDNGKSIRETRDIDIPLVVPPLLPSRRLGAAPRHANSPDTKGSASSGKSSRGTSRCSCSRGRSRRH